MATLNGSIQAPETIVVGLNVSYTVPTGRVARVKACLDASASAFFTNVSYSAAGTASGNAAYFEFVAPAGTVISSTRTAASGSGGQNGVSTTTMTINGSNSSSITCRSGMGTGPSGSTTTTAGSANFGFYAEEYFG